MHYHENSSSSNDRSRSRSRSSSVSPVRERQRRVTPRGRGRGRRRGAVRGVGRGGTLAPPVHRADQALIRVGGRQEHIDVNKFIRKLCYTSSAKFYFTSFADYEISDKNNIQETTFAGICFYSISYSYAF